MAVLHTVQWLVSLSFFLCLNPLALQGFPGSPLPEILAFQVARKTIGVLGNTGPFVVIVQASLYICGY